MQIRQLDDITLKVVLWKCRALGRMEVQARNERVKNGYRRQYHNTQLQTKQSNVVVTMATRHILGIFEIS